MMYNDYASLRIGVKDGTAWVSLDHPPINLLDAALMTELDRFANEVAGDGDVRVIVFQSANPEFFIAHGDMNFVNDPSSLASLKIGDENDQHLNPMQKLHERIRTLPQVTLGKLAGVARGGGAEFLEALDMRFAARGSAGLEQIEALAGILPGVGGTAYLPRLMGRARALEAILGAELFDADLAERYGWINRALPADKLDEFVDNLARSIAALAPGVIAAAKSAIDAAEGPLADALREQNQQLTKLSAVPAAAECNRAALEAGAQTRAGERNLEAILKAS